MADVSIEELDSAMPLLKSAKQQMSLAESDFTNQNYAAAAQRFDKAKDLFVQYEAEVKRCVEISKMREKKERKEAERQQKEANEARKRAEEAKAAVYASDWSFAIYQLSSADLEFKKGNFRAANNLFLAAKMTFDKGVKEVKAFPCLHLIAKVGGKEVAGAKLYDGECDHVTPIDWKLDHGKEYGPYVVSYDNDGKPYRGDFPATTADWYGPKTVAIELKDVTELFLAAIHEDNYTEASKMVDALETTTNADAQFWIGWMYDKGKGVETNYVKAAVWYRKAAEQGEGRAQNNLGYAYMEGLGVETNYVKAVEWYRKAAEQGNAVAQYNLGYMYENGNGVKEDLKEALKWYGKSADQGDPDAKKAMKRILMSEAANPEPKPMMSDSDEAIIEEEKLTVGKLRDANRLGRESCEQNVDVDLGFWIDPKVPSNKYFRVRVASKASNPLPIVSKDVVFLLDVSGSIGNDRLRNCRNAVMDALGRLNTGDRFNLVAFRDKCSYAFPDTAWREVDVNSIEEASKWLQTLRTHGQTDVFRALRSVLALPRTPARPMVAFVATDADATSGMTRSANIISRFSELNDGLVSIFMYGVKPEANAYLMDMLTRGNRGGWACHKGLRWEVGKSVPDLAKKFEKPVLTDIDVIFSPSSRAETYPGLVPNLCEDESIEIYGVCPADQKELVFQMRGLNAVTACESTFSLPFSSAKPLDARLRVEWAMRRLYEMIAEYTRKSDKNLLTNIHSFAAAYGLQDPYKEGMEKESAMSGTRVPDNTTGARPNSVKAIR